MADQKLSQLNPGSTLSIRPTDDFYMNRAGTPARVTAGQVGAIAGNVINFGADPTGVADSTAAFQAAVDSDYAVYVPFGSYYTPTQINVTKPKVIIFEDGLLPPVAELDFSFADGERSRLWTDQNNHFLNISADGRVIVRGGTFDTSAVAAHTKAVFYLNGNARNWGTQLLDFNIIGNDSTLSDVGNGTIGIFYDPLNATQNSGYLTHLRARGRMEHVRYGYFDTDYSGVYTGQFANGSRFDLEIRGFKQAVNLTALSESSFYLKLQALWTLDVTEKDLAAIELNNGRNMVDFTAYDFKATPDGGGHYKPNITIENNSFHNQVSTESPTGRNKATLNEEPYVHQYLDNPTGFLSRMRNYSKGQPGPVVISDLHNLALGAAQRGTVVVDAYQGDGITDFTTLTADSITEGISVSTDITIVGSDAIFTPTVTTVLPKFTWNAQAVTDNDYVEVHVDLRIDDVSGVMLTLNIDRTSPESIQVLTLDNVGAVITNEVREITVPSPSITPNRSFFFGVSDNVYELIIRFIGATTASSECTVYDVCLLPNERKGFMGYIHPCGGQTIYGSTTWSGGSPILDTATTAQLEDISHTVNTGADKVAYLQHINTTTGAVVYAAGAADADVWINMDGSTAHTPI